MCGAADEVLDLALYGRCSTVRPRDAFAGIRAERLLLDVLGLTGPEALAVRAEGEASGRVRRGEGQGPTAPDVSKGLTACG